VAAGAGAERLTLALDGYREEALEVLLAAGATVTREVRLRRSRRGAQSKSGAGSPTAQPKLPAVDRGGLPDLRR
jgi:hypothetical protein